MNLDITPPQQIKEELTGIDEFLNITMSEQPEEIVYRGNDLNVYIARSGKLLADAKYWHNRAKTSEILHIVHDLVKDTKATGTTINALVNASCKNEQYLVDWCERVNRAATHQLDWCRSLLSKAKEEMRFSGMYNNK